MSNKRCKDTEGECFARDHGACRCLNETPTKCSFKKPDALITNGIFYPYNPSSCPDGPKVRDGSGA